MGHKSHIMTDGTWEKKIFQKTKNFIQNINNILQKNIVLKLHDNYKRNIYPDFDLFLKNKKKLIC